MTSSAMVVQATRVIVLASLFVFPALGASAAGTTGSSIQTDAHAVTCQLFSISWTGGSAPYKLDTAAPEPPLETDILNDTHFEWTPRVPAGTSVLLQFNDSSGTLAQTKSLSIQPGADTSCVTPPPSSLATNNSVSAAIASFTGSAVVKSNSAGLASPTSGGVSSPNFSPSATASPPTTPSPLISGDGSIASSGPSKAPNSTVALLAVIGVLSALILLVLGFLFLRLRKRTRAVNPFEDPESIDHQDLPPVSLNVEPYVTVDSVTPPLPHQDSPDKSLPVLPTQSQVTPEELQNALDRIQDMYRILQQQSSSASGTADSVRMVELQRQIQDLMADNAVLSGEQPPIYDP
ncbi:hypothetical protein C8R44DRAFT_132645 [Mycena epipterygia]|nr:hypothetical protein C8R44DRAFT_132645 [Mycena epipterygia]